MTLTAPHTIHREPSPWLITDAQPETETDLARPGRGSWVAYGILAWGFVMLVVAAGRAVMQGAAL